MVSNESLHIANKKSGVHKFKPSSKVKDCNAQPTGATDYRKIANQKPGNLQFKNPFSVSEDVTLISFYKIWSENNRIKKVISTFSITA